MSKILYFFLILTILSGCSLNKNSKFWTNTKVVSSDNEKNYEEIFPTEEALKKEFNANLNIKLKSKIYPKTLINNHFNNHNRLSFDGKLKKASRYKFSKIKNFHQYQPEILFVNNDIIFFDSKKVSPRPTIIRFSCGTYPV